MLRTTPLAFACAALFAIGTTSCQDRMNQSSDDGWTVDDDAGSDDPVTDAVDTTCHTSGVYWSWDAGRCVKDTGTDTTETTPDTGADTTETTPDTTETTPDTSSPPSVGQAFQGPKADVSGDTPVRDDHGLGLYWKNALVQFGQQALQRNIPNQQVLDLARIQTPTGDKAFELQLPKTPSKQLHFYDNYCDKVGAEACNKQGIDDDRATFAMAMVGLHEAPQRGKASDCTWGMIYGKRRCDFGRVVTRSRTILLYVYRKFDTSNYPVFSNLGITSTQVETGYNLLLPAGTGATGRIVPLDQRSGTHDFYAGSRVSFPMLYP